MMKTFAMSVLLGIFFVTQAAYADSKDGDRDNAIRGQLFFTNIFLPTFQDGFIECLNTDGSKLKSLVSTGDGARGIAFDPAKGKIYWSNINRHVISKASLDGTNQEDIVTANLSGPFSLDIDVKRKKIYWVDVDLFKIGRANLDGTNQTVLIHSTCFSSVGHQCFYNGGLAVDSVNKKLYWTTVYCSDNSCSTVLGDILRSDLEGSGIETVVDGVGSPFWIQVDPIGKKIYWTDIVNNVVRRSNLDGTRIDDLFVVGKKNNPNSLALDLKNGYIYWDQDGDVPNRSCIKRMDLNGNHPKDIKCGFGILVDIEFVSLPLQHAKCDVG